jgi:hypothetical protein
MEIWIALIVYAACVAGGIAYVVWRGIALWRQLKRTGSAFAAESSRIATAAGEIQSHLERASESSERLTQVNQRLAVSRAALDVQLQALREARHAVRRVLWFVPGI